MSGSKTVLLRAKGDTGFASYSIAQKWTVSMVDSHPTVIALVRKLLLPFDLIYTLIYTSILGSCLQRG